MAPRSPSADRLASLWRLLVLVLACAPRWAAGEAQASVLTVPSSQVPLQVNVPVPPEVAAAPTCMLEEQGEGGSWATLDFVPAAAPDGSPAEKQVRLLATIPPRADAKGDRRFRLVPVEPKTRYASLFRLADGDEKSVRIEERVAEEQWLPVLVYNHGMMSKAGVPERYNRAGYIHPLFGLDGEVLTEDFPKDHLHHRGVWWSWPHVRIEGKEYNTWIPTGIQTKHERWLVKHAGKAAAVLAAENGWYVGEKKVVREFAWITVYRAADGSRVVDLDLTWTPLDQPITLQGAEGKSYGGLTFRFAQADGQPDANKRKDTAITVESGKTERDLPDTRLKWADITGHAAGAKGRSGCAVFCPTDHPDYPPTWLTRHYGPLCIGWPGVKPKTFPPGQPFRLRYRLWVHRGDASLEALQTQYEGYVALDKVRWEAVGK